MEELTRRDFLKGSAAVSGTVVLGGLAACAPSDGSKRTVDDPASGESVPSGSTGAAATGTAMNADSYAQKWNFEIAPDPITDIAETIEADLVVVGAGTSGLATAVSAAEKGLRVILVSASTKVVCRGGSNHATYSRVMEKGGFDRVNVEEFYMEELAACSNRVDNRKWYKFYSSSEESMNWLLDMTEAEGYTACLEMVNQDDIYSPTNSPAGSHAFISEEMTFAGVGQEFLVSTLEKYLTNYGGQIYYKNIARQLVRGGKPNGTEGRVDAVICEREDGSFAQYVGTKAVVLATGDFSRDKDMMAKYCPWVMELINWEGAEEYDYDFGLNPVARTGLFHGDGHKMGLWVGAAWQRTNPCGAMVQGSALCVNQAYGGHRGLMIDARGQRFANEDMNASAQAMQLMRLPEKSAFAIWGTNYAYDVEWHSFGQHLDDPAIDPAMVIAGWDDQVEQGGMFKGATIEEVVEQLGLPLEASMATINRYNEMAAAGKDDDFHKKAKYLQGISEAPFYGGNTGMPLFFTVLGGLRTNENMQVCSEDDVPIPGLYNVGTMIGDMFSNIYNFRMQGHNYGQCSCFGYLTGRYIAENE
jgi:succinate dehydrogenase/fumarate reductase flavoprotein subunit